MISSAKLGNLLTPIFEEIEIFHLTRFDEFCIVREISYKIEILWVKRFSNLANDIQLLKHEWWLS